MSIYNAVMALLLICGPVAMCIIVGLMIQRRQLATMVKTDIDYIYESLANFNTGWSGKDIDGENEGLMIHTSGIEFSFHSCDGNDFDEDEDDYFVVLIIQGVRRDITYLPVVNRLREGKRLWMTEAARMQLGQPVKI